MKPPVISIVGYSDSGKTTLIERLVPELKRRGYRVGTIKHAAHGFDIDRQGTDSWRHKAAGADTVIVASPRQIAMVKDVGEASLDRLVRFFEDMDLVIAEGYKKENKPKIAISRRAADVAASGFADETLIAVVTDRKVDAPVPQMRLDEIAKLADLIERRFLSGKLRPKPTVQKKH